MTIARRNLHLLFCLALTLVCACRTTDPETDPAKQLSTLRIHLEVVPDMLDFSLPITVFRQQPVTLHVDVRPFLGEEDVDEATVVESMGAFSIQIKFNRHGTWVLEQYTTAYPGKHMAIFSQFGKEKEQSRWLAAPMMLKRNSKGILVFTPDATREETDRIVLGLNNAAKKVREKTKW